MNFSDQSTLDFLIGQTEHVEAEVFARAYPEITYAQDVPVVTDAPEWASSVAFFSTDSLGKAQVINGVAKDVPNANTLRTKHSVGISMAAIGYEFSLEEIGQAQLMGMNLSADGAEAARLAYEHFMDDLAYVGNPEVADGKGLYNQDGVTTVAAASTFEAAANVDAILSEINGIIAGVLQDSKGIERANTIHMPIASMALLAQNRLSDHSDTTILSHIRANNILTATTGEELNLRADHRLTDKLVAYRKDPRVLRLHVPMPLKFETAQKVGLSYQVPGMFRTSGLEIRSPGAIRYLTGIV